MWEILLTVYHGILLLTICKKRRNAGVFLTMGVSCHVTGTAHEITPSEQAICTVLGTFCPELELHTKRRSRSQG